MFVVESLIFVFICVMLLFQYRFFFVVVLYKNFVFFFKLQLVNVDVKDKKGGFIVVMLVVMNEYWKVKLI